MKLTTVISTAIIAVLLAFFHPVNAETKGRIFGKKKGSTDSIISKKKQKKKKGKGSDTAADISIKPTNPSSSNSYTPYHTDSNPEETLGPAVHCLLDSDLLEGSYVSYNAIDKQYPCLRDYCASLTTPEECNLDSNFLKGCGWCNGGCTAYFPFQVAFVDCVREAYMDHEPTKINVFANFPIGLPEQGGVTNLGNKRWTSSEVGRPAGERVPIHLHPFSGLSCLTTEGGTTIAIEGHESFHLNSTDCYSMPPMTKIGPYSANPDGAAYTAHDTFQYEACYPTWVVLEPDVYSVQYGQFAFTSDIQC